MLTSSPKIRLSTTAAAKKIPRARGVLLNAALIQELLGIPNYTHKVRSSDGSVIEVTANEDGAHRVEIDVSEPSSREPLLKVPRYAFFVEVRYLGEINYDRQVTKRFMVAKVDNELRGHTNKTGAKNPVTGAWKVIGYDDMDGSHARMPVPKLGTRGWAGNSGNLHNHEAWFGVGTNRPYHEPLAFLYSNYWSSPNASMATTAYTAGLFSAATHHTGTEKESYDQTFDYAKEGAYSSIYGAYFVLLSKGRQPLREGSTTCSSCVRDYLSSYVGTGAAENELKSRYWSKIYSQTFEYLGDYAEIFTADLSPHANKSYIYYNSGFAAGKLVQTPHVVVGVCSISADGTKYIIPTKPSRTTAHTTSDAWRKTYIANGGSSDVFKIHADKPAHTTFRQLRETHYGLEMDGTYRLEMLYPDLVEVSLVASEDVPVLTTGASHSGGWGFTATETYTGDSDNYTHKASYSSHASAGMAGYRVNELISTQYNSDANGARADARVTEEQPNGVSQTIEWTSQHQSAGVYHCAQCIGGMPIYWTSEGGVVEVPGAVTMAAAPYEIVIDASSRWTSVESRFDDIWSSADFIEIQSAGDNSTPPLGGVRTEGPSADAVRTIQTSLGPDDPCGYPDGHGTQWEKWSDTYEIISLVKPYIAFRQGLMDEYNALNFETAQAAAAAAGGGRVTYYEQNIIQSTHKELIVGGCGEPLYSDIDDSTPEIIQHYIPDPRATKRRISVQNVRHNMITNGSTITDPQWEGAGMYGLEAATGIFDPMLGIVERMFSGYKNDTMRDTDNVRLHLYEVKYAPQTPPVRIVKAEEMPAYDYTPGSSLDHYIRATYCGYVHGGNRSSVCFFGGPPMDVPINYLSMCSDDFQTMAILDGDNGSVVDVLALCGLDPVTPVATGACIHPTIYSAFICEIPEALSKQDWPPP